MILFSRLQLLSFAAVGALVALTAVNTPASADQPMVNLGPVGPYEPILTTVGGKRIIAFYVPDNGNCVVNAVVWDAAAPETPYPSARIRISLNPGQTFHLDGAQQQSVNLQCGDKAATLALVGFGELTNTGATK
jgi:hypothetical protein